MAKVCLNCQCIVQRGFEGMTWAGVYDHAVCKPCYAKMVHYKLSEGSGLNKKRKHIYESVKKETKR